MYNFNFKILFLKKIRIHQFKNHINSEFIFNKKINCFVGNNGVGKTNILDAIHYLSQTKSYFNYIDSQNIQFGDDYFMINGLFQKDDQDFEIQCNVKKGVGKSLTNNDKKYKRFSDHIGKFPIIIISPTDTNLIVEGSDIRRKYLDNSISQYKFSYLQNLINYNKILKQRNSLLKQFFVENNFDKDTLDVYDHQLINYGNMIFNERKKFINEFIQVFDKYYSHISENSESVSIVFKSQLLDADFNDLLKNNVSRDIYSNHTQHGIHKDDIIFNIENLPIKKIGSQGQQKTFLIALKLAQFEFINNKVGFKPILLLDDIFDKLDDKRVFQLLNFVEDNVFGQLFITDTSYDRCNNILSKINIEHEIFQIDNRK